MSLALQVARFCDLLADAATDKVSDWSEQVLQQAIKWSVFVECELSVMDESHVHDICAQTSTSSRQAVTSDELLDAHHTLYKTLLANPHLPNHMFWAILRSYRFLNRPDESCQDTVVQDLSSIGRDAAIQHSLEQMLRVLKP